VRRRGPTKRQRQHQRWQHRRHLCLAGGCPPGGAARPAVSTRPRDGGEAAAAAREQPESGIAIFSPVHCFCCSLSIPATPGPSPHSRIYTMLPSAAPLSMTSLRRSVPLSNLLSTSQWWGVPVRLPRAGGCCWGVCPRPSLCPSLKQQEQQLHPACAATSLSPRTQQQSVSRRARFAAGWAAAVAFRGKVAAGAPALLLLSLTSRNSSCSCLCRSLSLSGGSSGEQADCAAGGSGGRECSVGRWC
jgi:hypothetical protein